MFGALFRLFRRDPERVQLKTARQPVSGSAFSKWASKTSPALTVPVMLKKWPWYSRKPLETIQFKYEDRKGDYSIRTVDAFDTTYSYFTGYCYTREATRTFKLSRIIGPITVVQTGEILSADNWATAIYSHPRNKHEVDMGRDR